MYYIIIVLLTFIQTLWTVIPMDFPVPSMSLALVRVLCNYLLAAMILFSPLLFTHKRRWTYIVSILLDVWFIGNLIYFRSYGDVLNRWCLESTGNMNGLWTSILPFIHASDLGFIVITALWIVVSECFTLPHLISQVGKRAGAALCCACLLFVPQAVTSYKTEMPVSPFARYYDDVSMGRMWYIYTYGPIAHFGNETINWIRNEETPAQEVTTSEITPYLQPTNDSVHDCGNVLFVLFESLEDWVLGLQVGGEEVTPNLNRLAAHPMAGSYAMIAQVKQGKSSDARLICLNGLLPIYNGATAMRYAANTYPSWVISIPAATKQCFTSSDIHIWNQERNTYAYGFDSLFAATVSDGVLIDAVMHSVETAERPFVLATYTMASHAPFIEYADSAALPKCTAYDEEKTRYLNCVHYTDSVLGKLIDAIINDHELAATTRIIILGDHPIFTLYTPVPFILYDPYEAPAKVSRTLYQMDIYTTMVDRLQLATTWRGLGRNIADTCAYSDDELQKLELLSDRLIRTDYFAKKTK